MSLARLFRRRVLVAAALLPLVFGLLVLWSLEDRPERAEAVPAAVVNLDEPVRTGTGEDRRIVAAGRLRFSIVGVHGKRIVPRREIRRRKAERKVFCGGRRDRWRRRRDWRW